METIVKAKDQQAAEANKNASILLKELDLEKVPSLSSAPLDTFSHYQYRMGHCPMEHKRGVEFNCHLCDGQVLSLCVCASPVQRGEQEAGPGRQEGEAQGETQEEEGGAEEEAGGGGGGEDQGGVLRHAGGEGGLR